MRYRLKGLLFFILCFYIVNTAYSGSVKSNIIYPNAVKRDVVIQIPQPKTQPEHTFSKTQEDKTTIHVSAMIIRDGDNAASHAELTKLKEFWKRNELLVGFSFVILIGIIIYFVWRKKKKKGIDAIL